MIQATAGQPIGAQMTALDGSAFLGTTHVWITGDNGTQVIGSVAAGLCVSEGLGYQSYSTSIADTNYLKHIAFTFVGAGAVTKTVQVGLPYTMLRGVAGQTIGCQMTAIDGSDFAGVVTVYVTGDNGTQTLGATGSGLCALKGFGYYGYAPAVADNDFGQIAFTFSGAGAITKTIEIDTISAAQAGALAAASSSDVRYVQTIIRNAMMGIAALSPREVLKPDDAAFCLSHLNMIFDDWNADIQASYAERFTVFASTGANPETIGPTGTWVTTRPVQIDGVAYDIGDGTYQPIFVTMDPQWWARQTLTTDGGVFGAYYEPAETNGNLYFANVATTATNIRLMRRTELAAVRLTDAISVPPGYESALTLTLQERIASGFHAVLTPEIVMAAGKARARIFANNLRVSPLSTQGLGLPGNPGGWFDIRSRSFR